MLASKPCFLHTQSSDTRLIFIVESIPKKLEQNRPKTAILKFAVRKFGHRMNLFGHRFFTKQKSPKNRSNSATVWCHSATEFDRQNALFLSHFSTLHNNVCLNSESIKFNMLPSSRHFFIHIYTC